METQQKDTTTSRLKDELTETTLGSFLFDRDAQGNSHLSKGVSKNLTWIVLIALVLSGTYAGSTYFRNKAIIQEGTEQKAMHDAGTPASFDKIANDFPGRPVASLSMQYAADLLVEQAMTAKVVGNDEKKAKDSLEKAIVRYEKIVSDKSQHAARRCAAGIGLGIAYTGLSDLSDASEVELGKAKAAYEAVAKTAGDVFPHYVKEAELRIAALKVLDTVVVFGKEDPKPVVEEKAKEGEVKAEGAKVEEAGVKAAEEVKPVVEAAEEPKVVVEEKTKQ